MILVHDPSLSLWHYRPLVPIVTQAHLPSEDDTLDSLGRRATRRDRVGLLMPRVECDAAVIPSGIVLILLAIVAGMVRARGRCRCSDALALPLSKHHTNLVSVGIVLVFRAFCLLPLHRSRTTLPR